jgi:predicted Zn-dependent protease
MDLKQNQDLVKQVSDDLTAKLQSNSNFDGFQIFTFMRDHTLTRYANSVIHQPMSSKGIWANIKVNVGKKVISTKTTVDEFTIRSTIEAIEKSINKASEIPHFKGYAKSSSDKFVNSTGNLWNEDERAEVVDQVVTVGSVIDPRVLFYGKVETLGFHFVLSNSNDINKSHSITYNDFKVMGLLEENKKRGYGREVQSDRDPSKINIDELTQSAAKIAVDTLNASKIDPDEFTTILRPQALAELTRYTLFDLESSSFHQGNSAFSDRLGEQLFSEKLTVSEEPYNEHMIFASPIDSEGVERQSMNIIENGTPKHVFYNLLNSAEFLDEETSNGFAILPFSEYLWGGPDAMAMSVKPGDTSEDQMIEDTKRGLLVQTLWYSNTVNASKGIITGLTRDGLYLIEDGQIKHAVKNLRYTDSYLSFFQNIGAIGKETKQLVGDYNGSNVIPSMKLDKLKFVSGSK